MKSRTTRSNRYAMEQAEREIKWVMWRRRAIRRLTPELSRTAARNGGVVHVTMQPSREAVSA